LLFAQVEVLRGGSFKLMPSQTLVPGDIIAVVPGMLPADCVLLNGECIVDENMLTGGWQLVVLVLCCLVAQLDSVASARRMLLSWPLCCAERAESLQLADPSSSLSHNSSAPCLGLLCVLLPAGESVPVRKVPYNPSVEGSGYCPDKHASCTLYGGTQVAQARAPGTSYSGMGLSASASTGGCALAMVARTRFYSAKGQLLRYAGFCWQVLSGRSCSLHQSRPCGVPKGTLLNYLRWCTLVAMHA
jgi:magnesium-transporting ATPase (P-type)